MDSGLTRRAIEEAMFGKRLQTSYHSEIQIKPRSKGSGMLSVQQHTTLTHTALTHYRFLARQSCFQGLRSPLFMSVRLAYHRAYLGELVSAGGDKRSVVQYRTTVHFLTVGL